MTIKSNNWPRDYTLISWDKLGWQKEFEIPCSSLSNYYDMITWIYNNVRDAKSNVFWTLTYNPTFRFRREEDYSWFLLRWS